MTNGESAYLSGHHYAKLRQDTALFAALSDTKKVALLHERTLMEADRFVEAGLSSSEPASQQRASAIIQIGVFSQAQEALLSEEQAGATSTLDYPSWLNYARMCIGKYVSEKPQAYQILLDTWLFNPSMQQSLSRLVFSSIDGGSNEPSQYAAELLAGAVTVTA